MNTPHDTHDAEFDRQMEEAAALSPEDPIRRRVHQRVAASDETTQQCWVDLIAANESLRVRLLDVDSPAGMTERLAALPDQMPSRHRSWPRRLFRLAVAASVAFAVIFAGRHLVNDARLEKHLHALGMAMIDHHDHHQQMASTYLSIHDSDPDAVQHQLTATFDHFKVTVPQLAEGYTLIGARPCHLAGHPVVCTEWSRHDQRFTVIQFRCDDYNLPADLERTVEQYAAGSVTFFKQGDCTYALIEHEAAVKL